MIPHRQGEYIRYTDHEQAVAKVCFALSQAIGALDGYRQEGLAPNAAGKIAETCREALAALGPTDSGK